MKTPTPFIKKITLVLLSMLMLLGSNAPAIELTDIHMPMTRDEADTTLSKDYVYEVLTDGSVRRTWRMEKKQLIVDFDTVSNNAIMVAIIYDQPVSKKAGIEDAHTLAAGKYSEKASWDAPKDRDAKNLIENTCGLHNARRKKLEGDAVLFYELNEKNRISRVSLFARMPSTNRWALSTLSKNSTKTALGNQMASSFITGLYADEERRKNIPLGGAQTTPEAAEEPKEVELPKITVTVKNPVANTPKKPQTPKAEKPQQPKVQTASATPQRTPEPVKPAAPTTPPRPAVDPNRPAPGEQVAKSLLPPPPDWLKAVGIEEPTWWHYLGAGFLALLLLVCGIRAVSAGASRSAQRQRFMNVVNQGGASSGAKIKKR